MNKDTKVSLNTEKNNGTSIARVLVTGYKSDHLKEANVLASNIPTIKQGEVEHKIKLVLFDKLSLSSFPQSPLYVDSRVFATVAVHGGSGVFAFNIHNTSVAKLAYDGDSKDVKVYPITQGNAEVVVGDLCTPEYDQVTELLHFSGTHNLLVHGTDKVAVNSTVKFTVQPTDVYGTVFHPSQYPTYAYMDFAAKTELPHVYVEKTGTLGEFLFRSEYAGVVEVIFSVTTTQASPPIKASKSRHVIVFPPFRVIPSSVTLLVGETHDVSWKGGPYEENIYGDKLRMVFEPANPNIAVMEPPRIVRGVSLGSTTIRISPTLADQESEFNVYDELHVTVRQINGINVRSGSNTLLESNSMKLHVEGHDGESPLGFGLRSVFFAWESDNTRVLSVEHLARTSENESTGVSVRVVANAPGRATIAVTAVPVAGPDKHAGNKDILSSSALKDTITIEVSPKLGTNCDTPLLVPPHGSIQLFDSYRPYQEVKYSLIHPSHGTGCGDIIRSVSKDGLLKVGGTLGHCHVHVAATNTNQAIIRHIIVDKVALLITGPHREGDTILDVRQRVEYYVTPKNSLGSEFSDTERVQLDYEVQPAGIVKLRLDNLTLQVTADRPGKAVVRIFLVEDPKVQDFFEIHVRDQSGQSSPFATPPQPRAPSNQGYNAQVYVNKPLSHHVPFEPAWYQVEFTENKANSDAETTGPVDFANKFSCAIKEAQWATAKAHSTASAHYCIVTPTVPSSPIDIVTNLTLVIDSDYLRVHHEQVIPLNPIFAVIGPLERKFTTSLEPQSVTLFSSTPNAKVVSSSSLRVRPTLQRPVGAGYVSDYLIEFVNIPASGAPTSDEDYYIHFYEDGNRGSDIRVKLSLEEGSNYLLVTLVAVLVVVFTTVVCGIPYRTFPRAHNSRAAKAPTSPLPQPNLSSPAPTIQSPYSSNQSYTLSPPSLSSPQTPIPASPPRFVVNTNQNFYESQRLRGPKF